MFNSISALEKRARKLNSDYYDWIEHHSSGPNAFNPQTPTTVQELMNVAVRVEGFARMADELTKEPGFADATFDPTLKQDIVAMAEELATGHEEMMSHVAPDTVWARLDHGQKATMTRGHLLDEQKVDLFRARLRGDLRKQGKIAPPDDEPKPDPTKTTAPPVPPPPATPTHTLPASN